MEDTLELVSMGVDTGLQFNIFALSRISKAYCCWQRKKPEVLGLTLMPRKWWRAPKSDIENSDLRDRMRSSRVVVELAVRIMSST